jgi:hypothetical protein
LCSCFTLRYTSTYRNATSKRRPFCLTQLGQIRFLLPSSSVRLFFGFDVLFWYGFYLLHFQVSSLCLCY